MNSKEFFDKVKSDQSFASKFANVESLDSLYDLTKKEGLTDSKETFCSAIPVEEGLSDDDLDKVVGGNAVSQSASDIGLGEFLGMLKKIVG